MCVYGERVKYTYDDLGDDFGLTEGFEQDGEGATDGDD